jgi:hypothetical protein
MWSRPSCGTCSGSAGRCGAPPRRRRTQSLGRTGASEGYSTASIDPAARGAGLLLQEGGVPVRLRSCWLDDLDLADLARRAELLRGTTKSSTSPTVRLVEDEPA